MMTPVCKSVRQPMECSVWVYSDIGIFQQPNLTSYDNPSTWNLDSTGHVSVTVCAMQFWSVLHLASYPTGYV